MKIGPLLGRLAACINQFQRCVGGTIGKHNLAELNTGVEVLGVQFHDPPQILE